MERIAIPTGEDTAQDPSLVIKGVTEEEAHTGAKDLTGEGGTDTTTDTQEEVTGCQGLGLVSILLSFRHDEVISTNSGLRNITWDKESLSVFQKNFYFEHPAVKQRSEGEAEEWRRKSSITITGHDIPKVN